MRVSHCLSKLFTYKSLPRHASKIKNNQIIKQKVQMKECDKGTPSCTCIKGSLTVEAAAIFPLVAAFLVCMLFLFRVLQIEMAVDEALVYAGRMTAIEYSAVDNSTVGLVTAEALFQKELKQYPVVDKFVRGGSMGVSILKSKFDGDYVELCADYNVKIPGPIYKLDDLKFIQRANQRKWTGKTISGEEFDPYVYVAKTGSVYHTSLSCHYIDLSTKAVEFSKINDLRNLSGHKYNACTCAVVAFKAGGNVYVTNYGTNYHATLNCPGLKRTIKMIKKSETGGLPLCSKCANHENQSVENEENYE